jgi:hypothetical protein
MRMQSRGCAPVVGVEQAHFDLAANPCPVDAGEPVPGVNISTIWPGMAKHAVSPPLDPPDRA